MGDLGRGRSHRVRHIARSAPRGTSTTSGARAAGRGRPGCSSCAGWPISLAAVALMAVAVDRLLAAPPDRRVRRAVIAAAIAATVLCATIAIPGVIKQSDLDAKARQPARRGRRPDRARAHAVRPAPHRRRATGRRAAGRPDRALGRGASTPSRRCRGSSRTSASTSATSPACTRVHVEKVLPEPGHPHLHAVHLGNHEGLDGWLLAVTALLLRPVLGADAADAAAPRPGRLPRAACSATA